MAGRYLSLASRVEDTRNLRRTETPVHFTKDEIRTHFIESLENIKSQFRVADELKTNNDEVSCKLIWRSQVVLSEGLLDFYIHEISKFCLFQMFCGNWEKSEKYESFLVPMSKVEEAISANGSNEWFFEFLNNKFSKEVFLSSVSMHDQLNLIGVGFVPVMVKAFPRDNEASSNKEGKRIVEELFKRRNEIAHQNDRSHATAEQTDITKEFVESYINNIECIVNAIHTIIDEKDVASIQE